MLHPLKRSLLRRTGRERFAIARHKTLWQVQLMGKASKSKRRRRQQTAEQQALVDRVQKSMPEERIKVVKRQTGRKVSEILMEFAEPWLDEARVDDQRRMVIGMAVLAWNMAAFPEPERWETDRKLLFARAAVLDAARVKENWFSAPNTMIRRCQT
jgi:hypothetical protein